MVFHSYPESTCKTEYDFKQIVMNINVFNSYYQNLKLNFKPNQSFIQLERHFILKSFDCLKYSDICPEANLFCIHVKYKFRYE